MRQLFFLLLIAQAFAATAQLTAPEIIWQRCYGGSGDDRLQDMKPTPDGGYIMIGWTDSTNGQVTNNHGGVDVWVVKVDEQGVLDWQKTYGGSQADNGKAVLFVDDGYIFAASTNSTDGDLTENFGNSDIWVVKIDLTGNIISQHNYGGSGIETAFDMIVSNDGGYYVIGESSSSDGMVSTNSGAADIWMIEIDAAGELLWEWSHGGPFNDFGTSIDEFPNGDVVVTGWFVTDSGDYDVYVARLTSSGDLVWEELFGGSAWDASSMVRISALNEIHIAGRTSSFDGHISLNQGQEDVWYLKLGGEGNILSSKTYGGSSIDGALDVILTEDGGALLCGQSASTDGDLISNNGEADVWVIRLDQEGDILWQRIMGGSAFDQGLRVHYADGSIVVAGRSRSNNFDVSGNYGEYDYWLVQLGADPVGIHEEAEFVQASIYPNPALELVTLSLTSLTPQTVRIELLDAAGRIRSFHGTHHIVAGEDRINVDLRAHDPGIYHLLIRGAGQPVRIPVVKM